VALYLGVETFKDFEIEPRVNEIMRRCKQPVWRSARDVWRVELSRVKDSSHVMERPWSRSCHNAV
jgi:hypothetical protein